MHAHRSSTAALVNTSELIVRPSSAASECTTCHAAHGTWAVASEPGWDYTPLDLLLQLTSPCSITKLDTACLQCSFRLS